MSKPKRKTLVQIKSMDISNRDGELFVGKDNDGVCYLILEADAYHGRKESSMIKRCDYKTISEATFNALLGEP